MRIISEFHRDVEGRDAVDIVTEEDYYRWMFLHEPPRVVSFPARLVWVE